MNQINPKKLLHSKWTATTPENREKHFLVVKLEFDEDGAVCLCELEAVMWGRSSGINWRDLKNSDHWQQGWK